MELLSFFFTAETILFSICLILALVASLFSMLGVDSDDVADEFDLDGGNLPGFLCWLGFGRVPLLILLTSMFFFFGVIGLTIQFLTSAFIPWWLTSLVTLFPALMLTKYTGDMVAKHLPNLENYAHSDNDLIGKKAIVTLPNLTPNSVCEGKIDIPGQSPQYIRIRVTTFKKVGDVIEVGSYDSNTFEYSEK